MFQCNRCGAVIDAVALFHAENKNSSMVFCIHCSKIRERERLRSWATEWADATLRDDMVDDFFVMLEAVWSQGFTKSRTFENSVPIFSLNENPFSEESQLFDPLEAEGGLHRSFDKINESYTNEPDGAVDTNSVDFFFSDEDPK